LVSENGMCQSNRYIPLFTEIDSLVGSADGFTILSNGEEMSTPVPTYKCTRRNVIATYTQPI
jgi:hypothetical protein